MSAVERTATRITGFASPELDFQLMRQLGVTTSGGGAPGEIFAARARIADEDPAGWPPAFAARADALVEAADAARASGHLVTARESLLRASNYYRSAEYFSDPFGTESVAFGRASRDAFLAAAPDLPHRVEAVDIPFGTTPLPGYLMHPAGVGRANRTLVVLTGFDGTGEELYFQAAADALARGFTVLVAEGPGQVGCLRRHPDLLFRPDYEVPIAAILDYALTRPEIDPSRIALYGISFGGYFVTRAAVAEDRLAALVANSPIIDLAAYIGGFDTAEDAPPAGGDDEDVTLEEIDAVPDTAIPKAMKLTLKSAFRRYGVRSLSGWFGALEAYRVEGLEQIVCPCLALAGAGEGGETVRQLETFCARVRGPVTQRLFTVEEGADMHCQLGNLPLSNAVICDWLADTMG